MDFIDYIIPFISDLGTWLYWLSFAASLVESLAFVGIMIPGTAIVMLAGFASAQGDLNPYYVTGFVAAGAIIGDGFSYYLGTKGTGFFKAENRFFKMAYLERSKVFFEKHGNKSIFLARFVSPLRPFVPFFAGVSRMRVSVFIFWNVLSGVLWSTCFVVIGYFFGQAFAVIEMWVSRIGIIIVLAIVLVVGIWFGRNRIRQIWNFINRWF